LESKAKEGTAMISSSRSSRRVGLGRDEVDTDCDILRLRLDDFGVRGIVTDVGLVVGLAVRSSDCDCKSGILLVEVGGGDEGDVVDEVDDDLNEYNSF
jgi:hypothetical protein